MSGVNRTSLSIDDKLVRTVKETERQMVELKTSKQPIGAESLKVGTIPADGNVYVHGPFTIPAGGSIVVTTKYNPANPDLLTIWNFMVRLFVDARATENAFPLGTNLTSAMRKLRFSSYDDGAFYLKATNRRGHTFTIENTDSVSHNYWVEARALLPLSTGFATA